MSKRVVAFVLGSLFSLLLIAAVVMTVAAIWAGDDRWWQTAFVVGGVGFIGGVATATYPGWDW